MKSIIGRKIGMTQVFAKDGKQYPVTVIEVLPNVVIQQKTVEKEGYEALVIGYEEIKESSVNKARKGIFEKANTTSKRFIKELKGDELSSFKVGDAISVDIFKAGDVVDVISKSKGLGFSGTIKRYGHSRGPMGHGSGYHRKHGSMATNGRTNNRIHPGKKMPGHHGFTQKTILNLEVIAVDASKNAILIKGGISGANKSLITIRSAIKAQRKMPQVKNLVNYSA